MGEVMGEVVDGTSDLAVHDAPTFRRRSLTHRAENTYMETRYLCFGHVMAGISVTLEGNNIQLAFEKNDHTTAVVMDPSTAQSLILALGQMLLKIDRDEDDDESVSSEEGGGVEPYGEDDYLDVTSPTIDIGTDEDGQAVVALQAGPLPPFVLRLNDEEARHVAQGLLEILSSPRDVRSSHGDH